MWLIKKLPRRLSCLFSSFGSRAKVGKSSPLAVFADKVLLEHRHTFVYILSMATFRYKDRIEWF